MQESIKLARSKAKNPDQENIRQLKQDWNSDTSEFVHSLIQFKKLMNGRESDFYKQKSKITEPIPVEPSIVIQSLAQKFKELAEQAYTIGNKQKEYSGNRLARRKEASNKITRLLSYIKGPHFGSSPEATLNRSRKSLLSLAADVSKDFKILNSKILGRNHSSLLEAGAVFKRLRETLSAFVTFVNNLENPTKALPAPEPEKKEESKRSRITNFIGYYQSHLGGPDGAINKINKELKPLLPKLDLGDKEGLLDLIFRDIEKIEKNDEDIKKSDNDREKNILCQSLYEKVNALKETLKSLYPANIKPPRIDDIVDVFVDSFKSKDFPKKPEFKPGAKPGARKNKKQIEDAIPVSTDAPANVENTINQTPVEINQETEEKAKLEEENKLKKLNELVSYYNSSVEPAFSAFYNIASRKIFLSAKKKLDLNTTLSPEEKKAQRSQIGMDISSAKNLTSSNQIFEILFGIKEIIFNIKEYADNNFNINELVALFSKNYTDIIDNKIKNEDLKEDQILSVKDLFEKIKNHISSDDISKQVRDFEFTGTTNENNFIKKIFDSINASQIVDSKFKQQLELLIDHINSEIKKQGIAFSFSKDELLDFASGLSGFKNYMPPKRNAQAFGDKNSMNKVKDIILASVKKFSIGLLDSAIIDFKTLNEIPKDSDPKSPSELFKLKQSNTLKTTASLQIVTSQNKAFDWAKRKLHEISFWNKTSPLRLKISDFAVKAKKATEDLMDDLEHRISFELLENYKTTIVDLFSRIEDLMSALLAGSEAKSVNLDALLEARYLDGLDISPEDKVKVDRALGLRRQRRIQNSLTGL